MTVEEMRKKLLDPVKQTAGAVADKLSGTPQMITSASQPVTAGAMNGTKVGNPILQQMFKDATDEQITEYLNTGRVPESYANAYHPQNYTFWNGGRVNEGFRIDDSNSATWQEIARRYNAGDTQGAMDLVNGLSGKGTFGGYYDDAGNYWGFAQGYMGGANASYQPVLGGRLMTTGLDTTGTDIWLTPDGKALKMGQGGTLTDRGDTWSRYRQNDIADVSAELRRTEEQGQKDALSVNGGRDPYAADPVPNGNGGYTYTGGSGTPTTPYQQAISNAQSSVSGAPTYTPPQAMSYQEYLTKNGGGQAAQLSAPGAYDPESDTLWQKYLQDWADKQAPEYAGDPYQAQRDAALAAYGEKWQGSEYQPLRDQYLQNAANMEWNYDPNTDPVWQALQKQYLREGRRATEDTLGRYAAMTGGMPSTAAVSAATQAGDYYAAQLSDRLPQVYQDAYNRYLQEYQKQLGISDAYAGFDDREYSRWLDQQGQNLELADRYNQYGQIDYSRFLDTVDQFNKDRSFNYGAARDNQSLGRQMTEDQYRRYQDALSQANYEDEKAYNRYRDTVSDQRYDAEWAQKLREYADEQNWKTTEWQQYLREYGDKLSQQEREWAYQQLRDSISDARYEDTTAYQRSLDAWDQAQQAAKYGDYSGLEGLGIDTSSLKNSSYAYASDGSTYDFSTQKAQSFVNDAPNGSTMRGGDGSIWRKDEYGGITIEKNGKVYTYSNPVIPEVTGSGSGSGYRYSGGGSGSGTDDDYIAQMTAAGVKTYNGALSWLAMHTDKSDAKAKAIASDFMERLGTGDAGAKYTEEDISYARDLVNGKYPNANPAMINWAQQVMSDTYGLDFSAGEQAPAQSLEYGDLVGALDRMAAQGRSWDDIKTEIEADHRDGMITDAEYDQLREKYHKTTDNIPNSGKKHSNGKPMSQRFYDVLSTVRGKPTKAEMISALDEAVSKNLIHDYEIHIIMDYLELD